MKTATTPLAQEAWIAMRDIALVMKERVLALAAEHDLAPMHVHVLRALEPGHEAPMSAVAELLHCDPSNITGIVDRMEARGLVERRSASHDRRVKLLALTPAGEELAQDVRDVFDTPPPEIESLSRADQRALRDLLRRAAAD